MAQQSIIGLIVAALLPVSAATAKSEIPPIEAFLTPPYSTLEFGKSAVLEEKQVEIPSLAPGQSVAFYVTREGDVRAAQCSQESSQAVDQPVHELIIPQFAKNSLVEPGRFQTDIRSSETSSGFSATKSNTVIKAQHTESADLVAKRSTSIKGVDSTSNIDAENSSLEALAEQSTDNLGTEQSQQTLSEVSNRQTSIGSESDDQTLTQDQSEENLLRTEADANQRGSAASSSGQASERARLLALEAEKRGGLSGLIDSNDLSAIWEDGIGFGLLDESDELNTFSFSEHLLGIFKSASEEFRDLLSRWGSLKLADLMTGLASDEIREDAPSYDLEVIYNVELHCSTRSTNSAGKIYFGSLFGMHTELINKGAPIYEVLILSAPPEQSYYFAKPEETPGFVTEFQQQDNIVVTRVFPALETGRTFRNLYAAKTQPWIAKAEPKKRRGSR